MNKSYREISIEELSQCNQRSKCWISIKGYVYDVTNYLNSHPGGDSILLFHSGKQDSTIPFEKHHSISVLEGTIGYQSIVGKIKQLEVDVEGEVNWISLQDAETEAKLKLSETTLAYYSTGAEDEMTLQANMQAFRKYCWFVPRTLRNVSTIDLTCQIFNNLINAPIAVSPTALQGLASPELGELAAYRICQEMNLIHIFPHLSSRSWEDVIDPQASHKNNYIQIYIPKSEIELNQLLKRIEKCQFKVIIVTVDSAAIGKRERDIRTRRKLDKGTTGTGPRSSSTSTRWDDGFSWEKLELLIKRTSLPIMVKGVQRGDDAVRAVKIGCAGIFVSNHGGRNLDGGRPSLASLVEIHKELVRIGLRSYVKLFFDGGVRRGGDILKALCLGADIVGIGRPILYGLAARGINGIREVLEILITELVTCMKLIGCSNLKEIDSSLVEYPVSHL